MDLRAFETEQVERTAAEAEHKEALRQAQSWLKTVPDEKLQETASDLMIQVQQLWCSLEGWRALGMVGYNVRNRALELAKPEGERKQVVIEAGNDAAHKGSPWADAALYQGNIGLPVRTDVDTFLRRYSTTPDAAWNIRTCYYSGKTLTWCYLMWDMMERRQCSMEEFFQFSRWHAEISSILKNNAATPQGFEDVFQRDDVKFHFRRLNDLYDTCVARNHAKRTADRGELCTTYGTILVITIPKSVDSKEEIAEATMVEAVMVEAVVIESDLWQPRLWKAEWKQCCKAYTTVWCESGSTWTSKNV